MAPVFCAPTGTLNTDEVEHFTPTPMHHSDGKNKQLFVNKCGETGKRNKAGSSAEVEQAAIELRASRG